MFTRFLLDGFDGSRLPELTVRRYAVPRHTVECCGVGGSAVAFMAGDLENHVSR